MTFSILNSMVLESNFITFHHTLMQSCMLRKDLLKSENNYLPWILFKKNHLNCALKVSIEISDESRSLIHFDTREQIKRLNY